MKKNLLTGLILMSFASISFADKEVKQDDGNATEFASKERIYQPHDFDRVLQPNYLMGVNRHIVLFDLKPNITKQEKDKLIKKIKKLRTSRRNKGEAPYILSVEVGTTNISREGVGQGFDLAFIVTFNSIGDRNFYVGQDPVYPRPEGVDENGNKVRIGPFDENDDRVDRLHAKFKNMAGPLLNKRNDGSPPVLVFDYQLNPSERVIFQDDPEFFQAE